MNGFLLLIRQKKNSITAKFINKFDPIEVQQHPTFGGLSNIWGAKCLRLFKNQFDEWPLSYHEIAKYYETCEIEEGETGQFEIFKSGESILSKKEHGGFFTIEDVKKKLDVMGQSFYGE